MADLNTKQKILIASIQLFNENGLANVRLQQIADEIGISVGNLAYHFKNKEAIIEAVNENLDDDITEILSAYRLFPNLIDFDYQLSKYFSFLQKYPFYFLDLLEIERMSPSIHSKRQHHVSKMISQIRRRFDFNQRRGIIIKELREGLYDNLANSIWVMISFWHAQNSARGINGIPTPEKFKEMVWNLVYPYFTEAGKREFEQLIIPLIKHPS
ncbi:MAG: TetR family transcriptional regulator [Saprospiraceae bacterium]|nr:MAG: TetR family transcriptional regulator [Saprospiraceae bacterium]